jgi:hypothetical protein
MGTDGRAPAPQGVENFITPNKKGLSPMVHRRVETYFTSIEAVLQSPSQLPSRRCRPPL